MWALARDSREAVWAGAGEAIANYVERTGRLERARQGVRSKGAERELQEFEDLHREAARTELDTTSCADGRHLTQGCRTRVAVVRRTVQHLTFVRTDVQDAQWLQQRK